jgi:serine protease
MLQTGMRRFLLLIFLISGLGSMVVPAAAQVAHGLIIQLKPNAQEQHLRELPSALRAKRESLAQERMQAIRQGAGVASFSHRAISGQHRLMRFAAPLQGAALEDTMRRLRLHPDVASVEPNVRMPLAQVPNDSHFALQWHLGSRANATAALDMASAWQVTSGSSSVTVAVLDTGVLRDHPDLSAIGTRLLAGYDFVEDVESANDGDGRDSDPADPGDWVTLRESREAVFAGCDIVDSSWHGTFIAGQIGAATNNTVGVAGVNWNVRLLPVRVSGKCGALLSDILDGMRWAGGIPVEGVPTNPNPAKVINLSFVGDQVCSSSYQSVIDELAARGVLLVVAAGNGVGRQTRQLKRPADCRGVLAVGAVQRDGLKTAYSFVGANMGVMTTGGHGLSTDTRILSTDNAGLTSPSTHIYDYKEGTSFAAPLAAGVVSLMLAINPSLSPDALIARVKESSLPHAILLGFPSCGSDNTVACNCDTTTCGAGMLNPRHAVENAYAPAAVIAALENPAGGSRIALDGRLSTAVGYAHILSFEWLQITGQAVSLPNSSSSITYVTLPQEPGELVFKLSVTDSQGRVGSAQIRIETGSSMAGGGDSGGGGTIEFSAFVCLVLAITFYSLWLARRKRS